VDEKERGYDIAVGARGSWGQNGAMSLLNYRRFKQDVNGMNQLHTGAMIPLVPSSFRYDLKASANVNIDIYDSVENIYDESAGNSKRRIGVVLDAGLTWVYKDWEAGGTITGTFTPYLKEEVKGIVKVAYNWDLRFYERRQQ
jgi:hypothetical protein